MINFKSKVSLLMFTVLLVAVGGAAYWMIVKEKFFVKREEFNSIAQILKNPESKLKEISAALLKVTKNKIQGMEELIVARVKDANPEIQLAAIRCLSAMVNKENLHLVQEFLTNENPKVQFAAVQGLSEMKNPLSIRLSHETFLNTKIRLDSKIKLLAVKAKTAKYLEDRMDYALEIFNMVLNAKNERIVKLGLKPIAEFLPKKGAALFEKIFTDIATSPQLKIEAIQSLKIACLPNRIKILVDILEQEKNTEVFYSALNETPNFVDDVLLSTVEKSLMKKQGEPTFRKKVFDNVLSKLEKKNRPDLCSDTHQ